MLEIWLLRHGETQGNKENRYIGQRTDIPLCPEGVEEIKTKVYPRPEILFVSPMLRCRQTAEILFPKQEWEEIPELLEADFGKFENKNYIELSGDADYQAWIDSGGTLPFPGGESREEFMLRNQKGFAKLAARCREKNISRAAMVAHGGTLRNLMHAFGSEKKDFYDWKVPNGGGYRVETDPAAWEKGEGILRILEFLP